MKSEEFATIENPQNKGTKHMKLSFYIPTNTPQYVGGRKNIHFRFVTRRMENKRMMRKRYKKQAEYRKEHPLKHSLNPYIEASKCRTLDNSMEGESTMTEETESNKNLLRPMTGTVTSSPVENTASPPFQHCGT